MCQVVDLEARTPSARSGSRRSPIASPPARRLGYVLSCLDPELSLGPLRELADLHRRTPTDLIRARRDAAIDPH